jgi:quinoprotein glucose dehydrogenase
VIRTVSSVVIALVLAAAMRPVVRAAARRSQEQDPPLRTVWDGVYTEEQSQRGREVYREHCESCHADTLTGVDSAPGLVGEAFESGWNGLTVGDLFERTRISMPKDKPGTLGRRQVADLLAYIFDANGFPRGEREMETNVMILKSIRLVMPKPE